MKFKINNYYGKFYFLARVIGLVSVISSMAVILRYKEFLNLEVEAVKSKLFIYVSGFIFLIFGLSNYFASQTGGRGNKPK